MPPPPTAPTPTYGGVALNVFSGRHRFDVCLPEVGAPRSIAVAGSDGGGTAEVKNLGTNCVYI